MYRSFVFLTLLSVVHAAKILACFPLPSYSHQLIYRPIWKELALRGHQVTVITPDPLKEAIPNLREIDVHDISYEIWDKYNISSLGVSKEADSTDISAFVNVLRDLQEVQLSNPEFREVVENTRHETFDLLLVEPCPHAVLLKNVYNCTMNLITPIPLHFNMDTLIGNPNHPILNPDLNLPFSRNLNFLQRVQSVVYRMMIPLISYTYMMIIDDGLYKHYGVHLNEDLLSDASLFFTNVNPVLHPPKSNGRAIIEFSGIHINPEKPLPTDLKYILDNATEGIVYVSFGSNIKSSMMTIEKIQLFLDVFSELPFKVLWKFEIDNLDHKPNNVEIRKWLPQQDVLRHKNVKLFITQGGLMSLDEAMYSKTPVIVIPFFGDQHGNAKKVEDVGMGKSLNYFSLNKQSLKATISEVMTDKYYKRAEELYNIVTDQPSSAIDKVIWWIEYSLRHKDFSHIRSPAIDIPFYQYYLLDVLTFLTIIILGILYMLYAVVNVSKSYIKSMCHRKKKLN